MKLRKTSSKSRPLHIHHNKPHKLTKKQKRDLAKRMKSAHRLIDDIEKSSVVPRARLHIPIGAHS